MASRWLHQIEDRARQALPVPVFRYLQQGAGDGVSAAEAPEAWRAVRLVPHTLRDVTDIDLATTLLAQAWRVPFGIAPTTMQGALDDGGEVAMASAAATRGCPLVISSNAGRTFDAIAATGAAWWLQAYLPADRDLAVPMLRRAVEAGAGAIVLTVDTPVVSTKRDGDGPTVWDLVDPATLRVNFDPDHDTRPGAEKATDLGPHDIGWLAETTGLPVVVKGVLRPDDARRCVQAGASAVWVSNHGGRQLDRVVSTATCLPRVREAIGDGVEIYADGGIRDGADVLAALASGADAVFLGRVPLYALAADGSRGVERALAELENELVEGLRLAGCRTPVDARELLPESLGNAADLREL